MASGIIQVPLNIEYTTISSALAYEVKNGMVFVYVLSGQANGNAWTTIGTVPSNVCPARETYGFIGASSYNNAKILTLCVKTDGTVRIGNNGSTSYSGVVGSLVYPI